MRQMLPVCIAIDCFKFLGHEIGGCSWAVLSKNW